jgi:formylglycine-generating enzyme required for sulfatase activity
VGLDILFAQTKNNNDTNGHPRILIRANADDYLFELAQPDHCPSGTAYVQNGKPVTSLGVHERWDSDATKRYSRNLDPVNGKGIELVYLPSGPASAILSSSAPEGWVLIKAKGQSFQMGQEFPGRRWTYTFPAHRVSFTYDFMMEATQVTQAEYKKVAGVNPTKHPGDDRRPIDNVSWFDAVLYCNALSKRDGLDAVYAYSDITRNPTNHEVADLSGLTIDIKKNGYRLLTSAEYEYVVRAGTTTTWFFGDSNANQPLATNFAWCELNAKDKATHPVGQLKPNAFGVYDITGNLWMWCNDWYDGAYPETPQVDPTGPASGKERIARGGAFKNDVAHERSAYHWQWPPQAHNFEVGFRIARTVYPASGAAHQTLKALEAKENSTDLRANDYVAPFDPAAAGLTRLFDGKTLNGWVGDPECWKVIDGAIVGVKGNQNIMTVGDYDDFRIIISTRQVKEPSNHQGVGFWGEHMPEGKYGYGGCVDVMPPMNWTWDYTVNRGAPGKLSISRDLDKELGIKRSQWTQAEILVNRAKGTIRMAVNGIEMLYYTDDNPGRLKKGPIGLQAHGGNRDVRYKDIFIEVAPKEDRLITLKK